MQKRARTELSGTRMLSGTHNPFTPHKILIAFAWNKCSDRTNPD